MIRHKLLVPMMTLMVGSAVIVGANLVSAQENTKPETSLVNKIAQRFGLKYEDVQAVFDEHKGEMHTQMKLRFEDRLDQLVSDGKLTEAQKDAIIAKLEELKSENESFREQFKNMTPEERRAEMEKRRTELQAWANEQGIDLTLIGGLGLHLGHHGGFKYKIKMN